MLVAWGTAANYLGDTSASLRVSVIGRQKCKEKRPPMIGGRRPSSACRFKGCYQDV